MQKYKIRKIKIRKTICIVIRNATVLKRKKIGNLLNEQFDTIVCTIVDKYCTCWHKFSYFRSSMLTKQRSKSNVTCKKLYGGENFQSSVISAKHLPLRSAF